MLDFSLFLSHCHCLSNSISVYSIRMILKEEEEEEEQSSFKNNHKQNKNKFLQVFFTK